MMNPLDRAATHAVDLEAALEANADLMRIYSCIWYVSFGLFILWLGCVAYDNS
jgi:hypothetical protein